MHSTIHISLASVLILSGCAFEGTVVRKEFRPLPFSESLDLDGIYQFELRDHAGQIHPQMVTADVFSSYGVGDYFNDLQLASSNSSDIEVSPPAEGMPLLPRVPRWGPTERYQIPFQPLRTTGAPRAASVLHNQLASRPLKSAQVAQRHVSKATSVVHHSAHKHVSRIAKAKHRTAHTTRIAAKNHVKHVAKIAKMAKHKKHPTKVARAHRSPPNDPS